MKRITTRAWFGKRILGWGYRPVSLEGWLVTIVFLIAIIVNMNYNNKTTIGYAILVVMLIIFFIIARLTGDAPGSETWDKIKIK
jgi:L-asparagine transporter-like permease